MYWGVGGGSRSKKTLLAGYQFPTSNCSMCNIPVSETVHSVSLFVALHGYTMHTQVFIFLSSIRFILKALNEVVKYLTAFFNHTTENSILKFFEWQSLGL